MKDSRAHAGAGAKEEDSYLDRVVAWAKGHKIAAAGAVAVAIAIAGIAFAWLRPPAVAGAKVRGETVVRTLAVTGSVTPRLSNVVRPIVSGRLVELNFEEGAPVREGDLLARIEDDALRAQVGQASAAVAAQRGTVAQARRDYSRAQQLHRAGVISTQELEQARLKVTQGEDELRRLESTTAEATARREDYELRAPFDGVVLERPVDPGQNVGPDSILYEIATVDAAQVEAQIDEQFVADLRTGQRATIAPVGGTGRTYEATLCYLSKRIDERTGAAVARFCFDGDAPELPVGLSVDVNVTVERHENATTVPRAAVAGLGADPFVYTVAWGNAERRPVRVIDWPAERLVVLEGLEPGDEVVLDPKRVDEGARVRLVEPNE